MGRCKRDGYVFIWRLSDHAPAHVHVHRNGKLIAKWNLENNALLSGKTGKRLENTIHKLIEEGVFDEMFKTTKG